MTDFVVGSWWVRKTPRGDRHFPPDVVAIAKLSTGLLLSVTDPGSGVAPSTVEFLIATTMLTNEYRPATYGQVHLLQSQLGERILDRYQAALSHASEVKAEAEVRLNELYTIALRKACDGQEEEKSI